MLYDCKGKYLDLKEQALQERTQEKQNEGEAMPLPRI